MQMQRLAVVLCLAVISGFGCGGDDDDDTGGSAGSAGSTKQTSKVSAKDAAGGACEGMASMMQGSDCKGIDEYTACYQDKCGSMQDACLKGACKDLLSCYEKAPAGKACDAATANMCASMVTDACTTCQANIGTCVLDSKCFDKIMCGETAKGGACDQLDACCAKQQSGLKDVCAQAASGARTQGDATCKMVITSLCMTQ